MATSAYPLRTRGSAQGVDLGNLHSGSAGPGITRFGHAGFTSTSTNEIPFLSRSGIRPVEPVRFFAPWPYRFAPGRGRPASSNRRKFVRSRIVLLALIATTAVCLNSTAQAHVRVGVLVGIPPPIIMAPPRRRLRCARPTRRPVGPAKPDHRLRRKNADESAVGYLVVLPGDKKVLPVREGVFERLGGSAGEANRAEMT
ncbi:hypothetical protein OKW37_007790 [Paraburkholderia sp. MM5482-R2]